MLKWNGQAIEEQIKRLAHIFQVRRGMFLTALRDQGDNVPMYDVSDSSALRFDALKNMMALLLVDEAKGWLGAITTRVHQVIYYEWYLKELRARKEEHAL